MTTKTTFLSLLLTAMMCVPMSLNAQVTIGSGRAPSEWSLLYLCTYEQQKALHNARMTTVERDLLVPPGVNAPAGGLMIFNHSPEYNCLQFWNGRDWISLCEDRIIDVDNLPSAPIENGFVGAFWRDNQTEERLIRMPHAGNWTAIAMDDWIVLDRHYVPFLHSAENAPVNLPDNARGRVSGTGDIYFRIGLTGTNPNAVIPGQSLREPRYGRVIVTHSNNAQSHTIWIRQGEAADFVFNRPNARRFSPFNLTAANLNQQVGTRAQRLAGNCPNNSRFVQYPTQTGAFWQWGGVTNQRMAWHPTNPPTGTPSGWNNANISGTWATLADNHETCPPNYRRPRDGDISATTVGDASAQAQMLASEMRQSLLLVPPTGRSVVNWDNNITFGFYADGFFDRRQNNGATVAAGTYQVANRGLLFFNTESGASLFFPAAGVRNQFVGATPPLPPYGRVDGVGNWAWYWTATAGVATANAWRLEFRVGTGVGHPVFPLETGNILIFDGHNPRSHGFPIRCVRE